jgi:predicted O-methyltransferase YrrM
MKSVLPQLQRTIYFISYLLKARHRRGYGIHSPFAFHLVTKVIEETGPFYCYKKIEQVRAELLKNNQLIPVCDFGTGISAPRAIKDIARCSLKPKKYAQLLFRLVHHSRSRNIFDLGTSLGITTAYLASAHSLVPCTTFEGCPHTASVAQWVFDSCAINNVTIKIGDIDKTLPEALRTIESLDFVFFDANHTKEATLRYFEQCLSKVNERTVFVFDDIYHSKGMKEAWEELIQNQKVTVTINLFALGIVYFNTELKKKDYIVVF